jgi:hypothetical protein
VFATELLATDVLGVVMARTMWARREKSSAGFILCAIFAGVGYLDDGWMGVSIVPPGLKRLGVISSTVTKKRPPFRPFWVG